MNITSIIKELATLADTHTLKNTNGVFTRKIEGATTTLNAVYDGDTISKISVVGKDNPCYDLWKKGGSPKGSEWQGEFPIMGAEIPEVEHKKKKRSKIVACTTGYSISLGGIKFNITHRQLRLFKEGRKKLSKFCKA